MSRLPLAILALVALVAHPLRADEVRVSDGRKLVGRIVADQDGELTILTYKDGPIVVPVADVKAAKKSANLYDDYDAKAKDVEDSAQARFELGEWCKRKGLLWQAREEWRKAIDLDPDHEAARKALGDRKGKDGWVTFEEQQQAKGLEWFEGKWLKPADIDRIRHARHPNYGWVLTAAYKDDADRKFLESWAERAKKASAFMWELTEGQLYIKQITVTDKGGPADFTIVNQDQMKIRPGVYAEAGGDTITAPGLILEYTFFHELMHFKYAIPHCDSCRHCIMSSDPTATRICDDADHKAPPSDSCWGKIRRHHKAMVLKPLTRKWKRTPVPETKVIVVDR
jgi:hypothetical protein